MFEAIYVLKSLQAFRTTKKKKDLLTVISLSAVLDFLFAQNFTECCVTFSAFEQTDF
jgi:hypothetical protein